MLFFRICFKLFVFSGISLVLCIAPVRAQGPAGKQTKVRIGFVEGYEKTPGLLDGRFSKMRSCLENELDIELVSLRKRALLSSELSSLQVLIFPRNQIPLADADFSALEGWIRSGGCLVFLHEPLEGNDWCAQNVWQFLADYGIRALVSAVTGSDADIVSFGADFGAVPYQIKLVECAGANCFMAPTEKAQVLCQNTEGRILGMFNSLVGRGKVIVLGDSECWSDSLFDRADNKNFFVNTIRFCLPGVDLKPVCLKVKPSKGDNKRQIVLITRVKNLAKAPSIGTTLRFSLIPVGSEAGGGEVLAESTLPALPGKKGRKLKVDVTIPKRLAHGQYQVVVTVDPHRFCNDLDESNNELAAGKTIEIN
jgi:hypothetical protein